MSAGARRFGLPVPVALIAIALIPLISGTMRLIEVFGGPRLMPHNPRITDSPAPAAFHILGGALFLLVGAFQFSPRIRRRHPAWHRGAGRALIVLGLSAALSALWMTLFYPRQTGTGEFLHAFRLVFGSALATSLVMAFRAIRRHDIAKHRAWMITAYALALGAGTQAFTIGIGQAIFGKTVLTTDLTTAAGWFINLSAAGYLIRRPARRRAAASPSHPIGAPVTSS